MSDPQLIVRLKGGLGNQLFQYAASRALARRNNVRLVLDGCSGFARDKVFRRNYSLDSFPIQARLGGVLYQLPFWYEQLRRKFGLRHKSVISFRVWGAFILETRLKYMPEVFNYRLNRNTWMEGGWGFEAYFQDCRDIIARECMPPAPADEKFLLMAQKMESCNSVAVGVRIYEERPGSDKSGVAPFSFYERAAEQVTDRVTDPTFFVFCSSDAAVRDKFKLPGKIQYITPDNDYDGSTQCLWLFSRCRNFIISNSSFYWWGAWLAEYTHPDTLVIACDFIASQDTVPARWVRVAVEN